MICEHTCYAFDWCRPFCLFSVNFCQSIPILDVDYVLFSKRNAPEISSCGGDRSLFFPIKEKTQNKQNRQLAMSTGHPVLGDYSELRKLRCYWLAPPDVSPQLSGTAAANFSPNDVSFFFSISHEFLFFFILSLFCFLL